MIQIVVAGVAQGCVYGMIALGFVLIYKATEQVNFAQGDIMMLGMFTAFTLIATGGLSWWLGIVLAIAVTGAFGFFLDKLMLRQIIGQPQFAVVILTIALGFIFRSVAGGVWGADPVSFTTPYGRTIVTLNESETGNTVIDVSDLVIILGTIILVAVMYAFFRFTRIGIAMQAASQNQLAACYMGIPVKYIFSLIWGISAAVSCVAGILLAPKIATFDPDVGFLAITAFAAAVIGGFGSLPGALLGGLIIGVTEQLAQAYLPGDFARAVAPVSGFVILLVVLLVRPDGLFAQTQRKKV
ncbi:MAG: branched-chain amino acid ABC transporter permease [Rhodospirillaceae bacterium]|nr:branched-chain amino acid ABC transporter permease [Rhodospirillaceae bacterium]